MLRNRPFATVLGDVEDLEALTRNHFFVVPLNVTWPNSLFSDTNASYRKLQRPTASSSRIMGQMDV